MRIRLSYVKAYKDRHGRMRYYFRRKGQREIPLPGKPGSPEFQVAYNKAIAALVKIGVERSKAGRLSAVIAAYYEDESFTSFAPATRAMRRRILEKLRVKVGHEPIAELTRGHVVSLFLSQLPPFERNNWLKALRGLMKFAVANDRLAADPTAGIERSKAEAGSIHTWSEAEIARFEARHGIGSAPRLALALLLYTAQRRSDVVRMGPQHVQNGFLFVRQKKTKMEKVDRVLRIPLLPELQHVLDATPSGALGFLVTQQGVPFTEKGFGVRFAEWCKQAGLPEGCSAHGLRKAACVRLIHAGCTPSEVQAISGHRSIADLKPYIEKVEQERLAQSATDKLIKERSGTKVSNRSIKSV
jgi:integrase